FLVKMLTHSQERSLRTWIHWNNNLLKKDTLEQQLTKETILESNCQNAFRVLKTQFEKIFSSVLIKPSSLDGMYARKDFRAYTSMEPQLFKEIILKNFDFIEDYMLKTIIHAQTIQKRLDDKKLQIQECTVQEVKALDAISKDKAKKSCMQLDKEEFQEIGSTASFKVLETQFQMFIKSRIYLDDEYVDMTCNKFLQYTRLEIPEFRDTLIQHMESVKKSIDERAQHKREYDSWVNERQIQTTEDKVDTGKAVDASLVNTESIGTESKEQDTSSRSGNDAHADDADIRPIYDEEPMVEVQTTAEINIFATGQQHTEQPEFNNEGKVDQNVEQCHDTCPLPAKFTDNQTTELSNQSLESENIRLKKTVAQFQKDFLRMEAHCVNLELKYQNQALKEGQHGQFLKVTSNEAKVKHDIDVIETINIELEHKVAKLLEENETLKRHYKEMFDSIKTTRAKNIEHTTSLIANNDKFKAQLQEKGFAIAALKNELRKLTGNSVNTKFAKSSILGKPALQPRRNQSVVRQPTAFKSERPSLSKQRFASQVDVNNDLSKPVTTHYLPKERESAVAKPHHMIAPGSSRYSSNDMVHNHYLEEAKKKTQESSRNSEPSVMPSARSQSTANGSKPKPRINNQKSRNWPASKRKTFASSTTKVESEPPNGSNADIPNQCESEQALNVSAGTLLSIAVQASVINVKWCLLKITLQAPFLNVQMMSDHNSSDLAPQRQEMSVENVASGPVPQCSKMFDRNRSSLGLHGDDVCSHQFRPRSSSNDF
ncbi:hypothetical protein Tco_0740404, partial [Tanacetum coccineum]